MCPKRRHDTDPVSLLSRGTLQALEASGVNTSELLADAGRLADLEQRGFWSTPLGSHAVQQVAALLAEKSGDPRVGLRLALAMPEGSLGIVEYMMQSADSLRHALELNQRFAALLFDYIGLSLSEEGGQAVLGVVASHGLELHPVIVDYRLVRPLQLARRLLAAPTLAPFEVRFNYPRPASLAAYEQAFGPHATLRFGCDLPALCGPSSVFDRPLPGRDPLLNAILTEHAQRLMTELPRLDTVTARVHHEVASTLHATRPSVGRVARRLHMSERTLRRRLAAEDVTFGHIVDRVRAALATLHMRSPEATADCVAPRLGFETGSAFRRAYKRWIAQGLISA